MGPISDEAKAGISAALTPFLVILVVDALVIAAAFLPLMDHYLAPGYTVFHETALALGVLLVYVLAVLVAVYYGYRLRSPKAVLIAVLAGLLPVLVVGCQLLMQLLEGPPKY